MNQSDRIKNLEKRIERLEALANEHFGKDFSEENELFTDDVVEAYDFSKTCAAKNSEWKVCNAETHENSAGLSFSTVKIERSLGVFYDPMLVNENLRIPLNGVKYVHIRLKSNVDASKRCFLKVYFTTEKSTVFSESKSALACYTAGKMTDVYVEIQNRYWSGMLTKLRIDPVEMLRGSIEVELIELLDDEYKAKYSVDFMKADNLEGTGWNTYNTSYVSCNGKLTFDVETLEKKRIYTDPFIVNKSLSIYAEKVKYIHIKLRTDIENTDEDISDVYMQIFFKTKSSDCWSQDKSMRFVYKQGEEVDAYIEIKQLFWKGEITALRIDPFESYEGKTSIKIIELLARIPDETDVCLLESRTRRIEDRFNRL